MRMLECATPASGANSFEAFKASALLQEKKDR